jgi:hypothetical protein
MPKNMSFIEYELKIEKFAERAIYHEEMAKKYWDKKEDLEKKYCGGSDGE